jgi:peptidyl-tRNA hydrolase
MALFQKKPQATDQIPIYTIGSNKTALVIGLGNPEEKFNSTRHNIGFAALEYFAQKNDFPGWINKKDLKCEITTYTLGDTRVILCKPTTYMNLSGEAAQAVQHFYLGEDYARLRLGIGNEISEKAEASSFVLGKFTKDEQENIDKILREANSLINDFIFGNGLPHETRNVLT